MSKEQGVIVPILALTVAILLLFAGILIFTGYQTEVRTELQAAADAAAHAGASKLCSQKRCWAEARLTAGEVIKRHSAHKNYGTSAALDFTFNSADSAGGTGENLIVSVERGRWLPPSNFESFEDWESSHPGLIGFAAANAVKVTITASRLSPAELGSFFSSSAAISVTSTAVADAVSTVDVAPLALPICALLSNNGDYDPAGICGGERLFTETVRHCPSADICGVLPYFPIEPYGPHARQVHSPLPSGRILFVDDPAAYSCNIVTRPPDSHTVPADDDACRFFIDDRYSAFDVQRFDDVFDHFGVVGLPGRPAGNENDIRNALSGSGLTSVTLGDPFYIYEPGLTESATQNAVWEQIINRRLLDGTGQHPPYRDTDLKEIVHHFVRIAVSVDGPGYGRCNSARYTDGRTSPDGKFIKRMMDTSVWKVRVPVIADRNGTTCRNDAGQSVETTVTGGSDHPWEIIGFITVLVHDVDIGEPPDTAPVLAPLTWDHELNRFWSPDPFPAIPPFVDPNCNLIRGQVECGADLLTKAKSDPVRKTVLVPS